MSSLRTVGELWSESPRQQQRELVGEVFEPIMVQDRQIEAITPKPLYVLLFLLDKRERFNGILCSMAPSSTPTYNPESAPLLR